VKAARNHLIAVVHRITLTSEPAIMPVPTCGRTARLLACAALLAPTGLAGQRPANPVEAAIVRAVDADAPAGLSLLRRLVEVNSGSMNFDGVRAVGAILRAQFDSLGLATRWVDGAPFNRAGHLVAEHPGSGPGLLLIGHLDTVFEPDHPFQAWQQFGDTAAKGPGVTDMKGGDVIIVQALKALRAAGQLDGMNITVVMTGDEESSGDPLGAARAALVEAAQRAEIAIGFEDGDGDPKTAVVARRGASSWVLRTTGNAAHSSQVFKPAVGYGAIFEVARILEAFRTELSGEPLLTFNPGVALGGTSVVFDLENDRGTGFGKTNVVAAEMTVRGDMRTITPEQLRRAQSAMRAIVARHLPGTSATITFEDGYPPLAPTDGNYRLLALYDQVSRDLGFGPVAAVDPGAAGAADVSFTAGHVAMAIDGLGLSGTGGHTAEETADLGMLPVMTKRAAVLLYRLSRGALTP
jgi:glutamate carboxypeptidase